MELFAVVDAVWASRTMFHAGVPMNGGATNASKLAQISGLHDIFLLNCYNNDWCNGLIYARNEGFKEVRFDRLGRFHFPVVNDLTIGTATSPSTLVISNLDLADLRGKELHTDRTKWGQRSATNKIVLGSTWPLVELLLIGCKNWIFQVWPWLLSLC